MKRDARDARQKSLGAFGVYLKKADSEGNLSFTKPIDPEPIKITYLKYLGRFRQVHNQPWRAASADYKEEEDMTEDDICATFPEVTFGNFLQKCKQYT